MALESLYNLYTIFLGNWIVIAGSGTLYFLMLRTFSKTNYSKLFNSFNFKNYYLILADLGLATIIIRELLLYPWALVSGWMPGSYIWEILVLYVGTTHLPSILIHSTLIYYLWQKYDNLVPAMLVGLFSIGLVEFTFIPQHLLFWGIFLGWDWYSGFAIILLPFIIEWKRFMLPDVRKLAIFITSAMILQYVIWNWLPYSITSLNVSQMAWGINTALLPHPPLETWIFAAIQWLIKILFVLGFSTIEYRGNDQKT